jgi:hypothetical protein
VQRIRRVFGEHARDQAAKAQTSEQRAAGDGAPQAWTVGRLQVEQPRTDGADRHARADALQRASGEEPGDTVGRDECQHAGELHDETDRGYQPPPEVIGDATRDEQGRERAERVDGIDQSKRTRRKPEHRLVDRVKR